jgi:sugar phosphate isomerase/epimerase
MSETVDIKLACMSLMWGGDLSNEEMPAWIDDVSEAGYAGVATFERVLVRFIEETDFVERIADRGLPLVSVDLVIDRDFDRINRVCEVMQQLGAKHLVTIGGLAQKGADMNEVADLLNQIGEIALTYDVRACFHNHTHHTGETLEETEELLHKVDSTKFFGFLDVGHATKDFVGQPVEQRAAIFLEQNWDRIDFLEFKDWHEDSDLRTEVGAGRCDYESVFQILKEKRYSGWITVEQNGPTGDKTPLECAKASREFIRQGLGV